MRVAKRRRLAAGPQDASPSAPTSPDASGSAHSADSDTDNALTRDALRMPPPEARPPMPQRSFADAVAGLRRERAFTASLPLTPPLSTATATAQPEPTRAPPLPPDVAADASPQTSLAQLRLQQQGTTIDQWRASALGDVDVASTLVALRDALASAQESLLALQDRPSWRSRRHSTLETLVEQAIHRMGGLVTRPRDISTIASVHVALPQQAQEAREAFLDALGQLGETLFAASDTDIVALEHAFAAFETLLTTLAVGQSQPAEQALRQRLVTQLWYRLSGAQEALSTYSIVTWTRRSRAMCQLRPSPQLAALVWLRTLLLRPSLTIEQCVEYTGHLREAWAIPQAHKTAAALQTGPGAEALDSATLSHLPAEPSFEPVARTELTNWIAVLPFQLPPLAPYQQGPIHEAFSQLAEALGIHIDVELGLPDTGGDAEMQERELAAWIVEYEAREGRRFEGFDAWPGFTSEVEAIDRAHSERARLADFFPADNIFDTATWPAPPRVATPFSSGPHSPESDVEAPEVGLPQNAQLPPPYTGRGASAHGQQNEDDMQATEASSQSEISAATPSISESESLSWMSASPDEDDSDASSEYSTIPDVAF